MLPLFKPFISNNLPRKVAPPLPYPPLSSLPIPLSEKKKRRKEKEKEQKNLTVSKSKDRERVPHTVSLYSTY
jgi:hypothetical protein